MKWLRVAAEQGEAYAQCSLGNFLRYGFGCEKNPMEAVKWLRMAADQGQAQDELYACLKAVNGSKMTDDSEASVRDIDRLRKKAKNGDAQAQYNLGVCLVSGIGCETNP